MTTAIRRWFPLAVLGAAALAAAALLIIRPWSGDEVAREAAATPAEYGICNVSVRDIPESVSVGAFSFRYPPEGKDWKPGPSGEFFYLQILVPLPRDEYRQRVLDFKDTGRTIQSNAMINAETGEIANEAYITAADEAKIKAVLKTLKVGSWEPSGPAWPRTDTQPAGEVRKIAKPLEVAADYGKVALRYREPERGAGMIVGRMSERLRAYTCDSIVVVDGATGQVLTYDVVPEEESMFQRFLDEVVTADGSSIRSEGGPS